MKISIVLAAYNEEKLIGRCIKALQDQDYPKNNYEIIIVDNNSTDSTSKIVKEEGLTPFIYNDHQGAIWAKHYAVSLARGEIVAVTDADSIPAKDWLKMIDEKMLDEKIQLVGGKVYPIGRSVLSRLLLELFDVTAKILALFGIPLVWGSNMAVRKKAFDSVGGFNTKLKTSDDWEFTMRIQKKYGRTSARYTNSMKVKVSPRKFEKLSNFIPYFTNGLMSFITIFILRKSWTKGEFAIVR